MTMADFLARYRPLYAADGVDGGAAPDPQPDPAAPATDPPAEPVAAAPVLPATVAGKDPNDIPEWTRKELNRKHAKVKAVEEENARLREMLDAATRPKAPADPAAPAADPPTRVAVDPQVEDARVERRAQELTAAGRLEDQLNAAVAKAKELHKEKWDAAYQNLQTLGGFDADTLAAITATDDPSKVLYELGADPAQYQRVMELPPHRRLNEIVKLGQAAAPAAPAPKKISDAPAPIEPITGSNNSSAPKFSLQDKEIPYGSWQASPFESQRMDSDSNDERWYQERLAQKKASKGRPWSANQ